MIMIKGSMPAGGLRPVRGATPDDALIELIAAGDRSGMALLYARHSARVYRFILRFIENEAIAEELVNEVFLDVWRNARKFEGRSQVSTWLLSVARHRALEVRRRRSTVSLDDDVAARLEDPAENAEATIDKRKTSSILSSCLAQLSPIQREIIDLIYYRGKTIGAAAAIVGTNQSTVKTRMFYARKRLSELLRAQGIASAAA
jgi:RNA polymerase sigma-70 factor (ECF subfamily)